MLRDFQYFANKVNEYFSFGFVYFTLDDLYKVKAVFIMVLDRITQIMATCLYQFTPKFNINIFIKQQRRVIGIPTVHKDGNAKYSCCYNSLRLFLLDLLRVENTPYKNPKKKYFTQALMS